jgi:hypothetical protein
MLHGCRKEARKQQLREAAGNIKSSGKDQQVRCGTQQAPHACLVLEQLQGLLSRTHAFNTLLCAYAGRRRAEQHTGMTCVKSCRP